MVACYVMTDRIKYIWELIVGTFRLLYYYNCDVKQKKNINNGNQTLFCVKYPKAAEKKLKNP